MHSSRLPSAVVLLSWDERVAYPEQAEVWTFRMLGDEAALSRNDVMTAQIGGRHVWKRVPEGQCDRSLARSAWGKPTLEDPSCREGMILPCPPFLAKAGRDRSRDAF